MTGKRCLIPYTKYFAPIPVERIRKGTFHRFQYMHNVIVEDGFLMHSHNSPDYICAWWDHMAEATVALGGYIQRYEEPSRVWDTAIMLYVLQGERQSFVQALVSLQIDWGRASDYQEFTSMSVYILGGRALRPHMRKFLSCGMLRGTYAQETWDEQHVDLLAGKVK